MYALFFFLQLSYFSEGTQHHITTSTRLYASSLNCSGKLFFFLLSESGIAELLLLLVEAFCSLAGKYSGRELFRFCFPKYELAFIIYFSLQYLNSDLFIFFLLWCFVLGLETGCLRVFSLFCFVVFLLVFQSASLL